MKNGPTAGEVVASPLAVGQTFVSPLGFRGQTSHGAMALILHPVVSPWGERRLGWTYNQKEKGTGPSSRILGNPVPAHLNTKEMGF